MHVIEKNQIQNIIMIQKLKMILVRQLKII